ncbi:hypothetical protein LOC68_20010 [Blastopirellula sp. JC732]|uniref:Uncharacterized protein n=1 Tax=Blastopirellula sediminis TaxID=2894196 RepID=A0A9X1SIC7_9BACT|nr:hypothetical protein [Blastopirellula sediminis]MCC9606015.1 hypothetical protein [Blastopirellula sediminis]MCC9630686.1 hypothetical protein [Blastopirellula sediminis]
MNAMTKLLTPTLVGCALMLGVTVTQTGCDHKEKLIDIETPRGEVKVEQDKDTGDINVEVNRDRQ